MIVKDNINCPFYKEDMMSSPEKTRRSNPPIVYAKGEKKTRDLIPTKKELIGKGVHGEVHEHRENHSLVVKKSLEDLTSEYEIGTSLDHPNLVKIHQIYVKNYGIKTKYSKTIYKMVMDKIEGLTVKFYYEKNQKIDNKTFCKLILEAKDCCHYLFHKKCAWNDLNRGNVFITAGTSKLRICDFGFWTNIDDSKERTLQLLMGSIQIVEKIVSISSLRGKIDRENRIKFPDTFFGENINEDVVIPRADYYKSESWMQKLKARVENMTDAELEIFLMNYFEDVLKSFEAALM